MTLTTIAALVANIASQCTEPATFDMLTEELLELLLAERGEHADPVELEWLEIATIALRALAGMGEGGVEKALAAWERKHGGMG